MSLRVEPTSATLGAYVTGVSLENLSDYDAGRIKEAFLAYGVLIFPNQHASKETQIDFCERFGRIEYLDPSKTLKAVMISNVRKDGDVLNKKAFSVSLLRGNEGWHTDSSYMPLSAKASCLNALSMPENGGGTGWADMRAAYHELSEAMKRRIENLSALHSLYYSQSKIGHIAQTGSSYGFHTLGAPLRPLVKTHPETGRKALYIGRHAYHIPGMDDSDAQSLLRELLDFACKPPRIYEHSWQVGDMAIWDNRCVLHRARPYNTGEPRVLRHVRIAGEPETESAPTMPDERANRIEAAT